MEAKVSSVGLGGALGGEISEINVQLKELSRTLETLIKLLSQLNEDETINGITQDQKASLAARSPAASSSARSSGSKKAGAYAGPAGFLWKPISDSTGKLAILLPPNMTGKVQGVSILAPDGRVLESGKNGGVGNGGREHFRFSRPGGAYPPGSQVLITRSNGTSQRITIEKPGVRTEGK